MITELQLQAKKGSDTEARGHSEKVIWHIQKCVQNKNQIFFHKNIKGISPSSTTTTE